MTYQLVLKKPVNEEVKNVGNKVYVGNLPIDYSVYLFYYPGPILNYELQEKLRTFGDEAGNNLFVNIGSLKDPGYKFIVKDFSVKKFPVIIMTSVRMPTSSQSLSSLYVRLDNRSLLDNPAKTIDAVGILFNLFISEEIPDAIQQASIEQRNATLSRAKSIVQNSLKDVWDYMKGLDITISLLEGKLELKAKGG